MSVADVLRLTGGVPLGGTVRVRGSKNSVPKLMVAALLTEDPERPGVHQLEADRARADDPHAHGRSRACWCCTAAWPRLP